MRYLAVVLLTLVLTVSCNEYQKVLKSEDAKLKYDLAEKFYNEGDFRRANRLFEQIAPQYIGKPQGERIIFMYANSFYQIRDYYTGDINLSVLQNHILVVRRLKKRHF